SRYLQLPGRGRHHSPAAHAAAAAGPAAGTQTHRRATTQPEPGNVFSHAGGFHHQWRTYDGRGAPLPAVVPGTGRAVAGLANTKMVLRHKRGLSRPHLARRSLRQEGLRVGEWHLATARARFAAD